jgi:hypothetical protein
MSILIYFWDSSKVDFEEILSFWDLSVPNLFSPFSQKVFMMFCQAPKILFQRETSDNGLHPHRPCLLPHPT